MIRRTGYAALLAIAVSQALPAAAQGEVAPIPALTGTRLDVTATGEVARVPDIVRITAGVSTQAATAAEALRQNSTLMGRVRAALTRAGIADRDVQTESLELAPVYRNPDYQRQEVVGYRAGNDIIIRFREVGGAGRVLDALVAEGVNEIRGPILGFDNIEAARDEARALAIGNARARAALYARALGMRVKRVVFVTEAAPVRFEASSLSNSVTPSSDTMLDPGGRKIAATVTVVFELE
jgi:uncharacterized protein